MVVLPGNRPVLAEIVYTNGMLAALAVPSGEPRFGAVVPLTVAEPKFAGLYTAHIVSPYGRIPCEVLITEKQMENPAFLLSSRFKIFLVYPQLSTDLLGAPIIDQNDNAIAIISSGNCLLDNLDHKNQNGEQTLLFITKKIVSEIFPADLKKDEDPFLKGKRWGYENQDDATRVLQTSTKFDYGSLNSDFAAFLKGIYASRIIDIRSYLPRQEKVYESKLKPGAVNLKSSFVPSTNILFNGQMNLALCGTPLTERNRFEKGSMSKAIRGNTVQKENSIHGLCQDVPRSKN